MDKPTALVWFRQDLRLRDNPALLHAIEHDYAILPVYILDDENAGGWKMGGASRWWLHKSLQSLNESLDGNLVFRRGDAKKIIADLVKETDARAVFWNRCYEPWRIKRDKEIKDSLQKNDVVASSFNAALLWEPWDVLKDDGTPYKVFTPYYRKGCLKRPEPAEPRPAPKSIPYADFHDRLTEQALDLLPSILWYKKMEQYWEHGEKGAKTRLETFLDEGLKNYKEGRNHPTKNNTSCLSPSLHFGEISPREIWHTSRKAGIAEGLENDLDCFCSELGWREFSHSLLYHFPDLPRKPLQQKFDAFPWNEPDEDLELWQQGKTGIPIVDAGMRELWNTGYMHNRVRMVVASFLIKNMLLHWHHGEDWFWDCLVDADLASNSASWQWVAGCGADAAPYFRVFNPVTQAEKFDPQAEYIKKWVPEYGTGDYPDPIVDLKASRERALEAYQTIKGS